MATLTLPESIPSPAQDAEDLRKACQGWGTDEKVIIDILAHRDAARRAQIQLAYEEQTKENLMKRLDSELSGDLKRAVFYWLFDPVERAAIMINLALKKKIDYEVLIEAACVNSPKELLSVKQAYHAKYKRSLEEDVAANTFGDFRKLLVPLLSTYRYDGEEIDASLAQSEARIIQNAIEQRSFNHDEIIRILSTRSKAQLNATFNHYKDIFGIPLTKALSTETPNEFALALRTAIRCNVNPHKYFVKVLRRAIDKSGTDEDALTRIVTMHAEKDLKIIKEMFQKRTNVTLEQAVDKETSRHYKSFILALLGHSSDNSST